MIVKIFNQGRGQGDFIVRYLLSEEKHDGYKPEIVEGNAEITKDIIASLKFKHKYLTGVISFKDGENLTVAQQHELINQFQKTFCPFNDEARINFLWVRHQDKGRLELHFLTPRVDLKTGKSFNMHPPGKANQLFFQSFNRLQNLKFGFQQVDKKVMTAQDGRFYLNTLTDLIDKRKQFIYNNFDTIKTRKVKNGKRTKQFKYAKFTNISSSLGLKNKPARVVSKSSCKFTENRTGSDFGIKTGNEVVANFLKHVSNANETGSRIAGWNSNIDKQRPTLSSPAKAPKGPMSLEAEILALGIELNTCSHGEAPAIIERLNFLQGVKSRSHFTPRPKFK